MRSGSGHRPPSPGHGYSAGPGEVMGHQGTRWKSTASHPSHTTPAWPGALTSCSSPFRRCSYSRICLSCFSAVSTLGTQDFRPMPAADYKPHPSQAPPREPRPHRSRTPPTQPGALQTPAHSPPKSWVPREARSPAPGQAPPSLLRRALQTLGVTFPLVPRTCQQEILLLHRFPRQQLPLSFLREVDAWRAGSGQSNGTTCPRPCSLPDPASPLNPE